MPRVRSLLGLVLAVPLLAAPGMPTATAPVAAAAPDVLTHRLSYDGHTVVLRLHRVQIAAPGYRVTVQGDDGRLVRRAMALPAAYLGTVDGSTSAVVSAVRRHSGRLAGQVSLDRGGTLRFEGHTVVGERGLDQPTSYQWPSAEDAALNRTVSAGQVGATTRRFDIAYDLDASYFVGVLDRSVRDAVDEVGLAAIELRATYERDARLRPAVGPVVLRGSASASPYPAGEAAELGTVHEVWAARPRGWDDVVFMQSHEGGGVAYVGTAGTTWAIAKTGSGNDIDVIRHELGHTWDIDDNHTNGPEGATIMSGNQFARFDGTELRALLAYRDTKVAEDAALFPKVATGRVPLPPYAALDLVSRPRTAPWRSVPVLRNDGDANGDRLTLAHVARRSHLGAALRIDGRSVAYRVPRRTGEVDWFTYRVRDTSGRTATGVVIVRLPS